MPDLTPESVMRMEAGPETDAMVGRCVMGWTHEKTTPNGNIVFVNGNGDVFLVGQATYVSIWSPSTNIEHALDVVRAVGGNFVLYGLPDGSRFDNTAPEGCHYCVSLNAYEDGPELDFDADRVWGPTLPVAICRAAMEYARKRDYGRAGGLNMVLRSHQ